jgi:hypothetical protein
MKILEPGGTGQRGWSKECFCTGSGNGGGGCGAKLLVEQTDLYRTGKHYSDGSSDYYETFSCSSCGVETDIKDVPYSIARALPSKRTFFGEGADAR